MPGQQTKLPAAKWALREKDEEAAILSPDNGRYKKITKAGGCSLGRGGSRGLGGGRRACARWI